MANYEYTTIDGERVEKRVAPDFEKMAAAFKKQFGLDLLVTSGTRTRERQQELYEDYIAGRGNQAAKPNGSRHQAENSIGPRALDLRDSGSDAGVQFIGSKRSNWLAKNAKKYNFTPAGHSFTPNKEGWHYEWTGKFENSKPAEKPTSGGLDLSSQAKPNKFGLDNVLGLQKISRMYADSNKKTAIDNDWGSKSEHGFDAFLQKQYGNSLDKGLAAWLRARWGYQGDDVYGPNMKAALKRANEANFREL